MTMFVLWISAAAIFYPTMEVGMSYPGHFPTLEACEEAGRDYLAGVAKYHIIRAYPDITQ